MEIRLSGHGAYRTQYHIVWITKYRRRILNPGLASYLRKLFSKILREMPGVEIAESSIGLDHVHLTMIIPPKYAVSDVIARIKARTSSIIRKRFSWLSRAYWKENVLWSPGFFVFTFGISEKQIHYYLKYQQDQDSGQAKLVL